MIGYCTRLIWAVAMAAPCFWIGAVTPEVEWSFETKGKIYASPILADLENDGMIEIIIAASRDQRLLCLDGRGALRWDFRLGDGHSDGFQATPSVVDYDGDGKREVFWLTRGGTAGCVDHQGRLIWRVFIGDQMDYTGPVAADLNRDGRVELVFGSESGTLYCLDDTGHVLWRYQGRGSMRGIPAVARLGASSPLCIYATFGGGLEACFDHDGNILWSFEEGLPRMERRSGVSIGDLDGDGRLETVSATEDFQVIVRDAETGAEEWRWKGQGNIDQTCSFALADFERTGTLDIVTGDQSGHVYRIHAGEAVWSASLGGGIVQGPSLGDVDGDGALEVLVCSRSNRLVCLSARGEIKWEYKTESAPLTTPALGDTDGDGQVEIIFSGKDRFVRCLSVGGAYDAEKLPWPMMSHDAQLSGNVGGASFTPIPAPTRKKEATPLTLERFGPMRMGENKVAFRFSNDSFRRRHLEAVAEVVRPDGSRVSQTVTERCDPYETKTCGFDLSVLAGGEYTLNVRLTDLGAGETLSTLSEAVNVVAFDVELAEQGRLTDIATRLIGQIADTARRERAQWAWSQEGKAAVNRMAAAVALPVSPASIQEAHDALRILRGFVARLEAVAATPAVSPAFAAVPCTTLMKVFRDESFLTTPRSAEPARIALARNEYEGVQLVVVPLLEDLSGLQVTTSALEPTEGAGVIREEDIGVNPVGYVEIGPPEYNFPVEKLGWYPDVLLPNAPVDVPASQEAQPFFITVHTKPNTPAGQYTGWIRLAAEGVTPFEIPLEVEVWDFALPEETTLKTSFWISEGDLQAFYGYEGRTPFEVRKRYYDMHLEHRMGPLMALPLGGGDLLEDFEYVLSHGQNNFFVHIPGWAASEERTTLAKEILATRDLIRERGWEDKVLLYSYDEVAVMARHLIPKVVEINTWMKELLPEWPRLETSAPEQSLVGAVDIWCPTIDQFNPAMLESRMAAGDRLWFYTVWGRPGIMIEFPNTDYRLMFWECWKYGAEGFLYWGTTHWYYNNQGEERWPERAWITYNSQPGHNGCGYMIYPGADGTPLASIRLDLTRDGIEDFEYFHRLRELLEHTGAAVPADLRKAAEMALAVDPRVVVDHEVYTEDPEALLSARAHLAELILALQRLSSKQ